MAHWWILGAGFPIDTLDHRECWLLTFENHVLLCRTQANSSHFNHSAQPAIRPSSTRTEDPTCTDHVDVLTVRSVFFWMSIINILRGLSCRLESLRLKFTNETSIFVDGDLFGRVDKAQCFRSARRFYCRMFEPGIFQGFFTTFGV